MEQKKNAPGCLTRRELLKCGLYCGVASALVPGFSANGYETGAVVASFVMDEKFGFAQGLGLIAIIND